MRGAFERDLLTEAEGRTAAGFGRRARRLRESRFPDLIPVRHREAKDKRRVMFQPLPDGMSCLSAIIAAEKGQAMFAALTSAAKAGKRAGDPRTMDQLRADTLTELLLEGEPAPTTTGPDSGPGTAASSQDEPGTGTPASDGCGCRGTTSTGTATYPGTPPPALALAQALPLSLALAPAPALPLSLALAPAPAPALAQAPALVLVLVPLAALHR